MVVKPKKKQQEPEEQQTTAPLKPIYNTYEDFNYADLLKYAGLDCIATSSLLSEIGPRITERPEFIQFDQGKAEKILLPSILDTTVNYEHEFHEFIIDMELNGIEYDVELNAEVKEEMEGRINDLKAEILSSIGKPINLDSGKELQDLLFGDMGLEPNRFTKKNQPSTDAEAMADLLNRYPEITWLTDLGLYGDLASTYRTFVEKYVIDHVKRDGRVHPQYNLHGTSSFRITGDNPNLTQLPRPKHGYNIRRFFKVRDGKAFLAADFSSAEVKILGAVSRDPGILQAIREGLDFHSFAAAKIRNIPYDVFMAVLEDKKHHLFKQYKEYRQAAKAVGFGILYGSTAAGIAYGLGISTEEGQALINLYFDLFPLLKMYIEDSHNMARYNQMVVTSFGRRKMEFGTYPPFKYTAVFNGCLRNSQNVRIQSTTSDVGLFAFSSLNKEIKKLGGSSLCTVYDSIEMEVPIDKLEEAVEATYRCMDDLPMQMFPWLDFPIGVEVELGYNWGDVEVVHRGMNQKQLLAVLED